LIRYKLLLVVSSLSLREALWRNSCPEKLFSIIIRAEGKADSDKERIGSKGCNVVLECVRGLC